LLKSLKFEYNKDSKKDEEKPIILENEEDKGLTDDLYPDLPDDSKLDEPCKTIWKIAFNREIKLAIFLVQYKENGADKFRLWIKGHP
jgi:hypothetical protein